jgi:hypothetical protein
MPGAGATTTGLPEDSLGRKIAQTQLRAESVTE